MGLPDVKCRLSTCGIVYNMDKEKVIKCYVDNNFASGWDQSYDDNTYNGMSCLVCSKLQEEIALSNREAEYIVLSKLIRNVINFMSPMKEILFIFDINLMNPEIYYKCFKDNQSCIDTTQSFKMRTKAEEFFEEFLGQEASLWEHVHDSPDFNVDATILGGLVAEVVELNDLLWGVV